MFAVSHSQRNASWPRQYALRGSKGGWEKTLTALKPVVRTSVSM